MLTGDVYLNGTIVGGTDYGYLGTEIDLSAGLKYGQKNTVAVKADTGKPENSRWYTGGGLYRDVNHSHGQKPLFHPQSAKDYYTCGQRHTVDCKNRS